VFQHHQPQQPQQQPHHAQPQPQPQYLLHAATHPQLKDESKFRYHWRTGSGLVVPPPPTLI
jgi:hypothetical protein